MHDSARPETETASMDPAENPPVAPAPFKALRVFITGIFMGLANIVPGVSGGTMVLALGLYEDFIGAVAEVTRPRFWGSLLRPAPWRSLFALRIREAVGALDIRPRSLAILLILVVTASLTILLSSSFVHYLMERYRPSMLALFLGMTLGGAPLLWRDMKPLRLSTVVAFAIGFCVMAAVAFLLKPGFTDPNWAYFFLGGVIGSMAMILPGISGSFMLLVMGLYVPIIFGISEFKSGLQSLDLGLVLKTGFTIILPVGLGLLLGIGGLSNLLKVLLRYFHRPTVGFLMGLLLGSVLGLYPFREQSVEKLVRYAVASEVPGGKSELRVLGFGWSDGAGDAVAATLRMLETDRIAVEILETSDQEPAVADIESARERQAIVVAYDIDVSRDVRRSAAEEDPDRGIDEVELVILSDVAPSPLRIVRVVLLGILGLFITWRLSRFESAP